ncbi:tetrahydromethanopterin S-methyltransferase subunit B [Methanocaldococcus sp.]
MPAYVFIDEKIPLVYNVETGEITKGFGDILFVDVNPIMEEINKLEKLVQAYEDSLDPRNPPLNSFPNRDHVYVISGYFKPFFFGFWITLGLMAILAILLGVKYF